MADNVITLSYTVAWFPTVEHLASASARSGLWRVEASPSDRVRGKPNRRTL